MMTREEAKMMEGDMDKRNLVEYCDVYRDGTVWVVVQTGQPQDAVRIGVGDTLREAHEGMEGTPVQSVGPDCGRAAALRWAAGAGWITAVSSLESVDDAELYEDEDEDAA